MKIIDKCPHHILCLLKWKGVGYDVKHTQKVNELIKLLNADSDVKIRITLSEDAFCSSCPKSVQNNGTCDKSFVRYADRLIQQVLNLKEGKIYNHKEIEKRLVKLLPQEIHSKICSSCGWFKKGTCSDTFTKTVQ